uniref:MFS domain-containing protein n=1 Tax=Bursaphelenchus xylophilus TaxID=6326 RepID=A0A1I7RWL3_BURXY
MVILSYLNAIQFSLYFSSMWPYLQIENGELEKVKLPPYDKLAVFICCFIRFTQMFTYTNLETLGSPMAMTIFALTKKEAVTVVATSHAVLSTLAFLIYGSFVVFKMDKRVNYRKCCILGLCILLLFHIVTYSYPFLPGHLSTYNNLDLFNSTTEPVGCNSDRFDWCDTVKPMNIYLFYIAYSLCIGIAFPTINLSMNTMFTQIIGPRRQATLQGIQQMFGSMARLTGPLIISNIYQAFGPTISWDIEILVLLGTIAVPLIFRRRLVPLKV